MISFTVRFGYLNDGLKSMPKACFKSSPWARAWGWKALGQRSQR